MLSKNSKKEVDLEEFAKSGRRPPKGCSYRFRVDREHYVSHKHGITGREILITAGKTEPEKWLLNQKIKGNVIPIGLDEIVDLTAPGVERFMTLPIDQTEGELRKEFALPEIESNLLDKLGLVWETIVDRQRQWLVIRNLNVPKGYRQKNVSIAILIPPGYPTANLDMIYVHPPLERLDGRVIRCTQAKETITADAYQRWSRHYTPNNPWKPEYNVLTHLELGRRWIEREVRKEAA